MSLVALVPRQIHCSCEKEFPDSKACQALLCVLSTATNDPDRLEVRQKSTIVLQWEAPFAFGIDCSASRDLRPTHKMNTNAMSLRWSGDYGAGSRCRGGVVAEGRGSPP